MDLKSDLFKGVVPVLSRWPWVRTSGPSILSSVGHRMFSKGQGQDGSGPDIHHLWQNQSELLPCEYEPDHLCPVTTSREKMFLCHLQDKMREWSTWALCLGLRQVYLHYPLCIVRSCLTPWFLWSSYTSHGAPTNCVNPCIKCPRNAALHEQMK